MRQIYALIALLLLTTCVSKRKAVTEVVQTKTEERVIETEEETKQSISEWVRQLAGSITISEVEYYPPTDTVQPSPQRYGAVKAERKTVVQLNTSEQSTAEVTDMSVSSKVSSKDEEVSKVYKDKEETRPTRHYILYLIIVGAIIGVALWLSRRPLCRVVRTVLRLP